MAKGPNEGPRPAWSRGESILAPLDDITAMTDVSPEWAWGGATGEGVTVAIIDSGVEADHPALGGCVDAGAGVEMTVDESGRLVERLGEHADAFGHGTACAGIVHGIAPAARVVSVKVLSALGGSSSVFLGGLAWAVERGFDVINLSMGSLERDWALPFYELCDRAYFRGSFVVTAANNVAQPAFPNLFASVTSVACGPSREPMEFHYNPEPPTEFLASGIRTDVAWRGGLRRRATGNSYAAPHIAGIAALIRSKHRDLRPFQLKAILWATAANVRGAPTPSVQASGRASAAPIASARAMSAIHAFDPRQFS